MIRTLLIILALPMAFLAIPAQADITVDVGWVVQYEITPLSGGGYTRTWQEPLELPYDECVVEQDKAQAAMNDREIAAARLLNYPIHTLYANGASDASDDGYVPVSKADCLRKRWVVMVRVTATTLEPIQCVRVWLTGFDWATQYADPSTCPQ